MIATKLMCGYTIPYRLLASLSPTRTSWVHLQSARWRGPKGQEHLHLLRRTTKKSLLQSYGFDGSHAKRNWKLVKQVFVGIAVGLKAFEGFPINTIHP